MFISTSFQHLGKTYALLCSVSKSERLFGYDAVVESIKTNDHKDKFTHVWYKTFEISIAPDNPSGIICHFPKWKSATLSGLIGEAVRAALLKIKEEKRDKRFPSGDLFHSMAGFS